MIIIQILSIIYVLYILEKTESLKSLENKKKYAIYFLLILLGFSNTQITIFNFSFDFLIVGVIVGLFEILLKYLKVTTKYLFLKIYAVILFVLLFYRGGIWILQRL
ncbi:hypothetical protein [Fusobacterium gonidiaformans]|jgi:hypothetical protein|uniref:hypothetical protein n=1 Tax=Fusobacterium gonidiaformans TaxID=849 RepID=UPI00307ED361